MGPICFYHDDPDGWTAAAIVKSRIPDAEMLPINHGDEFPWELVKDRDVIMVDFSLTIRLMMKLNREVSSLTWIDHHVSIIDEAARIGFDPPGIRRVEIEDGEIVGRSGGKVSGCELAWLFYYADRKLPEIIRLIGRFDVGEWGEDSRVMPLKYGFEALGESLRPDKPIWRNLLFGRDTLVTDQMVENGKLVQRWVEVTTARESKRLSFDLTWRGKRWLASNGECDVDGGSNYDGKLTFEFVGPLKKWSVGLVSLRSDFSVADIAKAFGGGGHDAAAGFMISRLPFEIQESRESLEDFCIRKLNGGVV